MEYTTIHPKTIQYYAFFQDRLILETTILNITMKAKNQLVCPFTSDHLEPTKKQEVTTTTTTETQEAAATKHNRDHPYL